MEIIEIGAVVVDGTDLQPRYEFQTFIRPVRNPVLTPFCASLTSITQPMLEDAPGFAAAMLALTDFINGRDLLFCSWGAYDNNQFSTGARYHGVALPFDGRHLNLKAEFSSRRSTRKRFGMASALEPPSTLLARDAGVHHSPG
ncbi:MAG: exonuclease domain-containing protein [Nannocystales bacterium]